MVPVSYTETKSFILIFQDDLFNTVQVKELLFEGYAPGSLTLLMDIYRAIPESITSLLPPLPDMLLAGKYGLWYDKNDTLRHNYYTINDGSRALEKYGAVTEFNGEPRMPDQWWGDFGPSPSAHRAGYGGMCKEIHGTDGQQFHPLLGMPEYGYSRDKDGLWVFTPDLCRWGFC